MAFFLKSGDVKIEIEHESKINNRLANNLTLQRGRLQDTFCLCLLVVQEQCDLNLVTGLLLACNQVHVTL